MIPNRRSFLLAGLAAPATLPAVPQRFLPETAPKAKKFAEPQIRYQTLGRTGLKVTTVGFGCMITSDGSVIERAADMGITYFDTARGYSNGNNERMVGQALKGKRKSIVLSSKTHAPNKQAALADLDTSLKELGTDHLDIWYLHAKSKPSEVTDDLFEAQDEAKKAGKIRFAGVSTHGGQPELVPFLVQSGRVDVLLTSYNFTMDPVMAKVVAGAANAGLGVVAMKVMAGGTRRIKPGDKYYEKFKTEGVMLAALKWVLKNGSIHTTIPSITDMDQLDENFTAMATPFSTNDEKLLAQQLELISPSYCRMCGGCTGQCAKGLPVADVLRYLMYSESYGEYALGRENFLNMSPELIQVRCADCSKCTVQCSHGVKVVERLSLAQECFA